MPTMHWTYTCDCGRALATRSEDDLVRAAQRHVVALHRSALLPPSRHAVLSAAMCARRGGAGAARQPA